MKDSSPPVPSLQPLSLPFKTCWDLALLPNKLQLIVCKSCYYYSPLLPLPLRLLLFFHIAAVYNLMSSHSSLVGFLQDLHSAIQARISQLSTTSKHLVTEDDSPNLV